MFFSININRVLDFFCCYLILLFVLSRFLKNGKPPQPSKMAFFLKKGMRIAVINIGLPIGDQTLRDFSMHACPP